MGKARRTGRQRTRRGSCDPRPGSTFGAGDFGDPGGGQVDAPPSDAEVRGVLFDLLGEAFDALDEPDEHRLDHVTASVAALCAASTTRRTVVRTLVDSTAAATTRAWQLGWQPADVHRLVGRRLGGTEQAVAVDAMRHELAQYAAATVDRQWLSQLSELDGRGDAPTAPPSVSWIEARRAAGSDWFTLMSQIVTVLHLLTRLPE